MAVSTLGGSVPLFKRLLLVGVVVFARVPFCQSAKDKLVGLGDNLASQNSRYVEIRRSPRPSWTGYVLESDLPQAHGIRKPTDIRRAPQSNKYVSQQQQLQQPQSVYNYLSSGYGLPPSLTPLIPPLMPFYPLHMYNSPFAQMLQQHNMIPQTLLPPPVTPPSPIAIASTPATLSATLNPFFTLPTLPTMVMPTFPPFTLPPAFDQMAAGYIKKTKKKKLRKNSRKAPKSTVPNSIETLDQSGLLETVKVNQKPLKWIASNSPNYNTSTKDSNTEEPTWIITTTPKNGKLKPSALLI